MSSSDIFRFMAVRAVQRATEEKLSAITIPSELPSIVTQPHGYALRSIRSTTLKMSRDEARQWAGEYIASPEFVSSTHDIATPIADFEQWLFNKGDLVEIADFIDYVTKLGSVRNFVCLKSRLNFTASSN